MTHKSLQQLKKENRERYWGDELCCLSPECEKSRQKIASEYDRDTTSYQAGVRDAMKIFENIVDKAVIDGETQDWFYKELKDHLSTLEAKIKNHD